MAEPIKKTTARNHELERWPNTGKQLTTPQWEPTVISEDIIEMFVICVNQQIT